MPRGPHGPWSTDLDLSAADWDPLSLECPDYNDPNYAKSACGVIQGRALSTILSVCFLHEICHCVLGGLCLAPFEEILALSS